jgi:exodeoxyribonuclease V gamma subunit
MIKSNKMEGLMDGLAAVLAQVPEDHMTPEWIGIQSRGMKQWITTQVAQRFGICANLSFLFPRQMMELFFSGPETRQDPQLNQDILIWFIMEAILENRDTPCFAPLDQYIAGDESGRRLFQLSMKIARVFDDYQIYRPRMLLDWEVSDENTPFSDPMMAWQSVLWKQIAGSWPHTHVAARTSGFLKQAALGPQALETTLYKAGLPARISLFGVSAMPPLFLELFGVLARSLDIYLFLLTPSNQFFFDIKSRRQMEKMDLNQAVQDQIKPLDPGGYYEMTNPLLASLGGSGRQFHSSLEAFDYHEPLGDLFEDPRDHSATMLSILQSDILNLVFRQAGGESLPLPADPLDISVGIHACHSPMREAQVLKDLLLEAFEQDPDLCPHDFIVMMPDIETYAPYLAAVFSCEHSLPFSISDRRKKSESQTLEAFLKILGLKDSRLEQARVLDLLLSPAIASKFDVMAEELLSIKATLDKAGVLWGRDGSHRQELTGVGYDENTWRFGFQRLFMGYGLAQGTEDLVAGVLPCDVFEGLEAQILGKMAHFGYTLFEHLANLSFSKTIPEWGECFRALVLSMMEKTHANEADMGVLHHAIDELVRDGEAAGYARKIDFSVARDLLEGKLDKTISQGSFLAGNITFCNLMPMRSIPFKVVVLMGMDEASFPRNVGAAGFDLIQKYPRPGDKQERQEDQYLFLESLLSARDRLIITYTGMGIKDNAPIPCSGVVAQLMDVIQESFVFPAGMGVCFHHPLHPFSPLYFERSDPDLSDAGPPDAGPVGDGRKDVKKRQPFFSFSQNQCKIAISQVAMERRGDCPDKFVFLPPNFHLDPDPGENLGPGFEDPGFEDPGVEEPGLAEPGETDQGLRAAHPICHLTLEDLVRFFRNPLESFVTRGLNLSFAGIEEAAPDREAFQLSGLDRYGLGSYYMDRAPSSDLYPLVRAGGRLPFGRKGSCEWDRVKSMADPVLDLAHTLDTGDALPALRVDIRVGEFRITGSITDCYENGRFVTGFGRLTPARLLTQWIYHLFLNAVPGQDMPLETHLIGQDPKKKLPAVVYSFGPVSDFKTPVETLISLYGKGQGQVLAFFCDTCFHLAQSLSQKQFEQTRENLELALAQSRKFWADGFFGGGESTNRYVELVFRHKDPFENLENLMASGIVDNALLVYQPLLENLIRP